MDPILVQSYSAQAPEKFLAVVGWQPNLTTFATNPAVV